VPARLAAACRKTPEGTAWLERLPHHLATLEERWSLVVGPPFDGPEVSAAWVAPVEDADGRPAVLKLGLPHMEARDELAGLRFWDGDPTVRVLAAADELGAMLLERCEPGTTLRALPEPDQDLVVAELLRRLWRKPASHHPFRPLAEMTAYWAESTLAAREEWLDQGVVRAGLELCWELPRSAPDEALLATDLHAGNVLRAEREPWLVIDPKPFLGDRAYDATQHLFNCEERLRARPFETIDRLASLLELDRERLRCWMFARAAAEPPNHRDAGLLMLARSLGR
jgi:streptomycin 6-kinase